MSEFPPPPDPNPAQLELLRRRSRQPGGEQVAAFWGIAVVLMVIGTLLIRGPGVIMWLLGLGCLWIAIWGTRMRNHGGRLGRLRYGWARLQLEAGVEAASGRFEGPGWGMGPDALAKACQRGELSSEQLGRLQANNPHLPYPWRIPPK